MLPTINEVWVYSVLALVAAYPFLLPAIQAAGSWVLSKGWPKVSQANVNHLLMVVILVMAALLYRATQQQGPSPLRPEPALGLAGYAQRMSRSERTAMSEAYQILSRAVAADPVEEPVFGTTQALREAHRAALLVVWRGVLANPAGKYPGLREELEGALEQQVGIEDVPMTPTIQGQAVKALADIASQFK
jgi:hypothetical protein